MAVPSYTTDLVPISSAEEASGTWAEPTATGWTSLNASSFQETDFPIQGTYCLSATIKTGVGGLLADAGSGIVIPTDGAFLVWTYFTTPGLLTDSSEDGIRLMAGSALNAFYAYYLLGKTSYAYGGWRNLAAGDPAEVTPDATVGSPSSTRRYFGWAYSASFSGTLKGNPYGVDAIRYGRCEARINGGEAANYATFAGFALQNDSSTYRWGLIQGVNGGYLWKGLMTLGYSSVVDFRDSNTMVMVDKTTKVTANFNKIEIRQGGSRVDWTNIAFIALGTVSKGRLEVIDDCDVNISGCSFTDMDTFVFAASSDVLDCVFRRCNTITANNAKFAGTLFDIPTVAADTSQLIWNVNTDPSTDLSGCSFTKGTNSHHAIEFGTSSPTSMTLTNVDFSGFNGSNGQTDSAVHFKRTEGTVTLTISGGSTPSYKTDGATIDLVTSSMTVKAVVQTTEGDFVESANVFLATGAAGGTPDLPYQESVTIVNSGTVATVTHSAHGMKTNDKVWIVGASLSENNGVFDISKIGDDSYSYTMTGTPAGNPTGTITSTFVYLKGTTDGNGEISLSRAIPSEQTASGWARKSSGAPYYKTGVIGGKVSASANTTFTAILSPDD